MDCDVIVVGAGVEGSSTAYQLIKSGVRRVLLLEQVDIEWTWGNNEWTSYLSSHYPTAFNIPIYLTLQEYS